MRMGTLWKWVQMARTGSRVQVVRNVSSALPKPWPRKPPKGQRCDAHTGSGLDWLGHPVLYACKQQAVETVVMPASVLKETWLCADHVTQYVAKGYAIRNPRRKRELG